jgi:hypothetical protein
LFLIFQFAIFKISKTHSKSLPIHHYQEVSSSTSTQKEVSSGVGGVSTLY